MCLGTCKRASCFIVACVWNYKPFWGLSVVKIIILQFLTQLVGLSYVFGCSFFQHMVLLDLIKKEGAFWAWREDWGGERSKLSKWEHTRCGKAGASFLLGKMILLMILATGSALIISSRCLKTWWLLVITDMVVVVEGEAVVVVVEANFITDLYCWSFRNFHVRCLTVIKVWSCWMLLLFRRKIIVSSHHQMVSMYKPRIISFLTNAYCLVNIVQVFSRI